MEASGKRQAASGKQGNRNRWARILPDGCCTEKDKDRVHDLIEKSKQRMHELCLEICDATMRAQCISDLTAKEVQLDQLEVAFLTACDSGDTDLIKEILKQIHDIIEGGTVQASTGLGTSQTGVHNEMDVFAEGDELAFDVSAVPTGETSSVLLVEGADGRLRSGSAALALQAGQSSPCEAPPAGVATLNMVTVDAVEYDLPSASLSLRSDGLTYSGVVSGSFSIAWGDPAPDGSVTGLPTSGELHVQSSGMIDAILLIDNSEPATIVSVDSEGDGLLAFQAKVASSSPPLTLLPEAIWFEVALHLNSATGELSCSTDGSFISGNQIAPRAPFPVADPDHDMLVTDDDAELFVRWLDIGDQRADANRDGLVNDNDLDYFFYYWDREMDWGSQP